MCDTWCMMSVVEDFDWLKKTTVNYYPNNLKLLQIESLTQSVKLLCLFVLSRCVPLTEQWKRLTNSWQMKQKVLFLFSCNVNGSALKVGRVWLPSLFVSHLALQ